MCNDTMCVHDMGDYIYEHLKGMPCPTDEELRDEYNWFLAFIGWRRKHPKKPGEEGYEFWKHYQDKMSIR